MSLRHMEMLTNRITTDQALEVLATVLETRVPLGYEARFPISALWDMVKSTAASGGRAKRN